MAKYIIYKDYNTGAHHIGYEYLTIDAKTEFEAIEQAEQIYSSADLYLIRILKKVGKVVKMDDGWKKQYYEAVMCKRSEGAGWHANTAQNCEAEHIAYRAYNKDMEYFDRTK